jgi:hypothetical protein
MLNRTLQLLAVMEAHVGADNPFVGKWKVARPMADQSTK